MIKTKTQQVIYLQDWDNLVQETYGKPYSFQQQEGCKERQQVNITVPSLYTEDEDEEMNDSIPEVINGDEMGVKFAVWLARDPKEWNGAKEDEIFIDLFWERNFYPDVNMIIDDLHGKGLLDAGEYAIDIDW